VHQIHRFVDHNCGISHLLLGKCSDLRASKITKALRHYLLLGVEPELGDYYLIEEIICDTIEPTYLHPVMGGIGEPQVY
jgi:hypothetical protein